MNYITVWQTAQQNQLLLLRNLFEQANIDFRILDENANNNFAIGARVQVEEKDRERAEILLREHGFIKGRTATDTEASGKFLWLWIIAALLLLILVGVLISEFLS